jgi:hypothetical protein
MLAIGSPRRTWAIAARRAAVETALRRSARSDRDHEHP